MNIEHTIVKREEKNIEVADGTYYGVVTDQSQDLTQYIKVIVNGESADYVIVAIIDDGDARSLIRTFKVWAGKAFYVFPTIIERLFTDKKNSHSVTEAEFLSAYHSAQHMIQRTLNLVGAQAEAKNTQEKPGTLEGDGTL